MWYIKMYFDKDLIEDKLYKLVDQFNKRTINRRDFCSTFWFYFSCLGVLKIALKQFGQDKKTFVQFRIFILGGIEAVWESYLICSGFSGWGVLNRFE